MPHDHDVTRSAETSRKAAVDWGKDQNESGMVAGARAVLDLQRAAGNQAVAHLMKGTASAAPVAAPASLVKVQRLAFEDAVLAAVGSDTSTDWTEFAKKLVAVVNQGVPSTTAKTDSTTDKSDSDSDKTSSGSKSDGGYSSSATLGHTPTKEEQAKWQEEADDEVRRLRGEEPLHDETRKMMGLKPLTPATDKTATTAKTDQASNVTAATDQTPKTTWKAGQTPTTKTATGITTTDRTPKTTWKAGQTPTTKTATGITTTDRTTKDTWKAGQVPGAKTATGIKTTDRTTNVTATTDQTGPTGATDKTGSTGATDQTPSNKTKTSAKPDRELLGKLLASEYVDSGRQDEEDHPPALTAGSFLT